MITIVRTYVPTFQYRIKQNLQVIVTGGIVELAEGIINDTCLV